MLEEIRERAKRAADAHGVADLMDRRIANNLQADDGPDPLPGHGADVAGAMALLLSTKEADESGA